MSSSERNNSPVGGNPAGDEQTPGTVRTQEKTTLGGSFNSGVTSDDDTEKDEIQKKGGMANIDQSRVPDPAPGNEDERR